MSCMDDEQNGQEYSDGETDETPHPIKMGSTGNTERKKYDGDNRYEYEQNHFNLLCSDITRRSEPGLLAIGRKVWLVALASPILV